MRMWLRQVGGFYFLVALMCRKLEGQRRTNVINQNIHQCTCYSINRFPSFITSWLGSWSRNYQSQKKKDLYVKEIPGDLLNHA